jgi:hypothetical protein
MLEQWTELGVGNLISERAFLNALYNHRHDHSRLPSEMICEIRRYVERYPDFRSQILQKICTCDWTVEELDELLR